MYYFILFFNTLYSASLIVVCLTMYHINRYYVPYYYCYFPSSGLVCYLYGIMVYDYRYYYYFTNVLL